MTDISYDEYGLRLPKKEGRPALRLLLAAALLATADALAGILILPAGGEREEATPRLRGVSQLSYPAQLAEQLPEPGNGQWVLPTGIALTQDGSAFVTDTENDRILKLDPAGRVAATFDSTSDERLALRGPMALASDGRSLFVANSLAAEVLVLDLSGRLQKTLPPNLSAMTPGRHAPSDWPSPRRATSSSPTPTTISSSSSTAMATSSRPSAPAPGLRAATASTCRERSRWTPPVTSTSWTHSTGALWNSPRTVRS